MDPEQVLGGVKEYDPGSSRSWVDNGQGAIGTHEVRLLEMLDRRKQVGHLREELAELVSVRDQLHPEFRAAEELQRQASATFEALSTSAGSLILRSELDQAREAACMALQERDLIADQLDKLEMGFCYLQAECTEQRTTQDRVSGECSALREQIAAAEELAERTAAHADAVVTDASQRCLMMADEVTELRASRAEMARSPDTASVGVEAQQPSDGIHLEQWKSEVSVLRCELHAATCQSEAEARASEAQQGAARRLAEAQIAVVEKAERDSYEAEISAILRQRADVLSAVQSQDAVGSRTEPDGCSADLVSIGDKEDDTYDIAVPLSVGGTQASVSPPGSTGGSACGELAPGNSSLIGGKTQANGDGLKASIPAVQSGHMCEHLREEYAEQGRRFCKELEEIRSQVEVGMSEQRAAYREELQMVETREAAREGADGELLSSHASALEQVRIAREEATVARRAAAAEIQAMQEWHRQQMRRQRHLLEQKSKTGRQDRGEESWETAASKMPETAPRPPHSIPPLLEHLPEMTDSVVAVALQSAQRENLAVVHSENLALQVLLLQAELELARANTPQSMDDLRSSCEEEFASVWEKHILRMERELRAALAEREAARAALWREMEATRQLRQTLGGLGCQVDIAR
mmetsp:Transcript_23965/g.54612  ORF Transcript_23965/g.54612 Transcript_23965/m.54612 type:complete len:641 (-) Transcript_23965:176-2098(-)